MCIYAFFMASSNVPFSIHDFERTLQFVQQRNSDDDELLSQLRKIEDRQYQNVSDVTKAAGMVY
jgi:hypothetical protein